MHTQRHQQRNTVAKPSGFAAVFATLCLVTVLLLAPAASYADASNRQQAITQALSAGGSDAKLLSVKEIINENGQEAFAVKIISKGRVKVIRINKSQ